MWHQMSLVLLACCLLSQCMVHARYDDQTRRTCAEEKEYLPELIEKGVQDVEFPNCDVFGNYLPKQCYGMWSGGGYCGCVEKITGQRLMDIKGVPGHSPQGYSMTCQCAADNWTPEDRAKKCDLTTGDYKPVSCDENSCGCVDKVTGQKLTDITGVSRDSPEVNSMTCQCASDNRAPEDRDKKCDLVTGDYKPVRCNGNRCYCAHRSGRKIEKYAYFEKGESNCLCARVSATPRPIGVYFFCNTKGGYHPVQCLGSRCFCVDAVGEKVNTYTVQIGSDEHRNLQC